MKIVTVIGARPQFIKAAALSRVFSKSKQIQEVIVHTGQHYDENMSSVFFEQLEIPRPIYQLNINQASHGEMTGKMLIEIELILKKELPDFVLVYGDTDSTLAGALSAAKVHIPVIHVESGLRSFNKRMPEELNRIMTDHLSHILFCPTKTALDNLKNEGLKSPKVTVLNVGDVMYDCAKTFADFSVKPSGIDTERKFILATLHRAENTNSPKNLEEIVKALNYIHQNIAPIILPLHPRTKKAIQEIETKLMVDQIKPVSYFEMLHLLKCTTTVLTDSGGIQKEAYFFGKHCVTLREQTEWQELVDLNVNQLVGADNAAIIEATKVVFDKSLLTDAKPYGDGDTAKKIYHYLVSKSVAC